MLRAISPSLFKASSGFFEGRPRLALGGDSLFQNYLAFVGFAAVNTTAGGAVALNGTVTFNTSTAGNHNINWPGQYIQLFAQTGDTNYANPLNGVFVPILSIPSATTFTVAQPGALANGDYSALQWSYRMLTNTTDSSWHHWLQRYYNNPFRLVANYSIGGTGSIVTVQLLPKILSGPVFDVFALDVGVNDVDTANSVAACIAAAKSAFANIQTICTAVNNYGAKVLLTMTGPVGASFSGNTTVANINIGMNQLRSLILNFALKGNGGVIPVDLFRNIVDGTGNQQSSIADQTAFVHPLAPGLTNLVKNDGTAILKPFNIIDRQPVSVLDDVLGFTSTGAPYPNFISNGLFSAANGTQAVNVIAGLSGTMPANGGGSITFLSSTGTNVSSVITRVAGTNENSNAVLWGQEWLVQTTWTAAGQGYSLNLHMNSVTAINAQIAAGTDVSGGVTGSWWEMGYGVRFANAPANLASIGGRTNLGTGISIKQFGTAGFIVQTYNTPSGDVHNVVCDPIFIPASTVLAGAPGMFIDVVGGAATSGACNLAFRSCFFRQIDNPYG